MSSFRGPAGEGQSSIVEPTKGHGDGIPHILMKANTPEVPIKTEVLQIPASSSGHRSRKEKLVLRSFSTEIDEVMMEPSIISHEEFFGSPSGKRCSRNRRTASAPASALTPATSPRDSEAESSQLSPSSPATPIIVEKKPKSSVKLSNSNEPIPLKKPKSLKLPPTPLKRTSSIKTQNSLKALTSSTMKKPKALKTLKKSSHLKTSDNLKPTSLKKSKHLKKSLPLKPPLRKSGRLKAPSPLKLPSPQKVENTQSSPRKQVKWRVKSRISRMIQKILNDGESASDFNLRPVGSEPTSTETEFPAKPGSKTVEGSDNASDNDEDHRKDLLHYAVGVACLEQILSPDDNEVLLPEIYYSMIENLVCVFSNGKENSKSLLKYARRLVKEKRRNELLLLMNGAHSVTDLLERKHNSSKSEPQNLSGTFRPIFQVGTVWGDDQLVSYPRITGQEIECFDELLRADDNFECWEDEVILGNVFLNIMQYDLKVLTEKMQNELIPRDNDDYHQSKRVIAMVIPVTYKNEQNQLGLHMTNKEFQDRLMKDKENRLIELKTRTLRNGKQVPLKTINIPGVKKIRVPKKKKNLIKQNNAVVPGLLLLNSKVSSTVISNSKTTDEMRLRSGRDISYSGIQTSTLLRPVIKLEMEQELESQSPTKTVSPEKEAYSRRVEANLRRMEEVGMDMFYVDMNKKPEVIRKPEGSRGVTRSRIQQLPRFNPAAMLTLPPNRPIPSSSTSCTTPSLPLSSVNSPYTFKPIQPQPSSTAETASPARFGKLIQDVDPAKAAEQWNRSESISPFSSVNHQNWDLSPDSHFGSRIRTPYSRRRHANICPPFDNNHCSFSGHFCAYPRAQSSRFCIQHADEGATVNFERCKYVKGSRECGRYIPKSQSQSLFCDIHALAIAKARLKINKKPKPLDKTPLLLKHMRYNLDRTQGKIMEPDQHGNYRVRKELWHDEREAVNDSSDSDNEDEVMVKDYIKNQNDYDSDVEDCDWGPPEDEMDYGVLKNAGYYSVDEVVKMHRSRLVKLRELYLREIETLKRQYKVARKDFLCKTAELKRKKLYFTTNPKYLSNAHGEFSEKYIQHQLKTSAETVDFLKHRRLTGKRALLHAQLLKRRQEAFESSRKECSSQSSVNSVESLETDVEIKLRNRKFKRVKAICSYGNPQEKCTDKAITFSKFCRKHIIQDKNQTLFTSCDYRFSKDPDDKCKIPVFSELEKFGCSLHSLPVPIKDPPDSANKKPKMEEDIDTLMDEIEYECSSSYGDDTSDPDEVDESLVQEMEELIGDELVDVDHFKETISYLLNKGGKDTDSEESEDTDEEEQNQPTEDGFNASPIKK